MTAGQEKGIAQNIPYVGVYETEQESIYKIQIDLEALTPILLFPPEAIAFFFETIKDYYQKHASEFIPDKLRPTLFDGAELEYGGTLSEQVDFGSVLFDNDEGDQY